MFTSIFGIINSREKFQKFLAILLAALLLGILSYFLFYKLGDHPLLDWDEGIYAQVSRELLETRTPFSLSYFGEPWLEKPPLLFWLTSASFTITGINELGARLVIPFFALGTIILTCLVVWHFKRSWLAIVMTLGMYFICYHFLLESFFLGLDIPVSFFILASLYVYIRAKEKPNYWYLFGITLGLGVLTKNIIGLFPLLIIVITSIINWNFNILKSKQLYYGLLIAMLVAAPWHIIESIRFGHSFWDTYLFYHVFDRFAQGIENNGGPFWYYLSIFSQNGLFLVGSICAGLYGLIASWKQKELRLILIAIITIFFIMSWAHTKSYAYIAPLYPYLIILIALTLTAGINKIPYKWLQGVSIVTVLLCSVLLGWQQNNFKIYKWGGDPNLLDNRKAGVFLQSLPKDASILETQSDAAGPALAFYANKNIQTKQVTPPPLSMRVLHQHARNIYFVRNNNTIVITP